MMNTSYEMAIQTYVTKQNLDEFDQYQHSRSSQPSDEFQDYWANNNKEHFESYQFPKSKEQHGKTSDERCKREQQSDKEFFNNFFSRWKIKIEKYIKDKEQMNNLLFGLVLSNTGIKKHNKLRQLVNNTTTNKPN